VIAWLVEPYFKNKKGVGFMKVQYFSQFSDVTGCTEQIVASPPTVKQLVQYLGDQYGEPMRRILFDETGENIHPDVFLLLNGRHLRQMGGLSAPLTDHDTVAILPITEAG
jgi:MoaD family protein